jgi:IclR family transcriptional regulator, KDG regulon repressor
MIHQQRGDDNAALEVAETRIHASTSVPAVSRTLDILELFLAHAEGGLTLPEITRSLRIPRSTAHDLVRTLVSRDYLQADGGTPRQYTLGIKLLELGEMYISSVDLADIGRQIAVETSRLSQETVHVAILDDADVIYVAKQNSSQAVRMVSHVGGRVPAHCTAGGKVLLAALGEDELRSRLRDGERLIAMTPNSITSLDKLREQLDSVRRTGLAYDHSESTLHAACVAAPVYDREGTAVAAISMSVPTFRWSVEELPKREQLIRNAAREFSRRLGYER